jgi:hypothetical protein
MLSDKRHNRQKQRSAAHALREIGDPAALPDLRKVHRPQWETAHVPHDDGYAQADRDTMIAIGDAIKHLQHCRD